MGRVLIGNFKGPQGDQGIQGEEGKAASIMIDSVQTLQPEENATVENVGTTSDARLKFGIPRGADGMTDLVARYEDASEYTATPTSDAPIVINDLNGITQQGENPSPDNPQMIHGVGDMGYFDGILRKGYYNTSGAYTSADNYVCTVNKIECKQSDNINVELETSATSIIVSFFQSSGTFISQQTGTGKAITATAPANAGYCMISINRASIEPQTAGHISVTINGKYASRVESNSAQLGNWNVYISEYADFDDKTGTLKQKREAQNTKQSGVKIQAISNKVIVNQLLNTTQIGFKQKNIVYDGSYDEIRLGFNGNVQDSLATVSTKSLKKGETYTISFNFESNDINAGIISGIMINKGSEPLSFQPYRHTSIQFQLTNPLYDGDKICYVKPGESYIDENGDTVIADRMIYGVHRENAVIKSYNSEVISGEYKSSTGELTTGAEVVYKLAQPYFEPFEDQTSFYNLRSFDNLTYIYSDDPLNPTLTVDVAKNQTGGYIFESLAQAMKNAQKAEAMQSIESRLQALETQAVENI